MAAAVDALRRIHEVQNGDAAVTAAIVVEAVANPRIWFYGCLSEDVVLRERLINTNFEPLLALLELLTFGSMRDLYPPPNVHGEGGENQTPVQPLRRDGLQLHFLRLPVETRRAMLTAGVFRKLQCLSVISYCAAFRRAGPVDLMELAAFVRLERSWPDLWEPTSTPNVSLRRHVEDLVIECMDARLLTGRIDQHRGVVEVTAVSARNVVKASHGKDYDGDSSCCCSDGSNSSGERRHVVFGSEPEADLAPPLTIKDMIMVLQKWRDDCDRQITNLEVAKERCVEVDRQMEHCEQWKAERLQRAEAAAAAFRESTECRNVSSPPSVASRGGAR